MAEYTANELINKLKKEDGIEISLRTLYFYAYDAKMFPDLKKGKCSFSDNEYEIIKRIHNLKNTTSISLREMKEYIYDDFKYLNFYSDAVNKTIADGITRGVVKTRAREDGLVGDISDICIANFANANINSSNDCISATLDNFSLNTETYANTTTPDYMVQTNTLTPSHYSCFTETNTSFTNTPAAPFDAFTSKEKAEATTVKINQNVTISVSEKITKEQLIDIVNYINNLTT